MTKGTTTVLLFTHSFPYNYAQERSFLEQELVVLQRRFEQVILVPKMVVGDLCELPEGIQVDSSLAERVGKITWRTKSQVLFSKLFLKEIVLYARHPLKFRYALAKILAAYATRDWLKENYASASESILLYSFWMDSTSFGALLGKKSIPKATVVTRCHNFDIYGNADNCFYVPYFNYCYPRFDAVFPDSDQGAEYLKEKVPKIRLKNGIMGVADPGFVNPGSSDGVFRIVSCAYLVERKRVGLFAQSLFYFLEEHPAVQLEWFHIGEGPLFEQVQESAKELISKGCSVHLLGNLAHEDMMEFYRTTPLDLFVNSSTFEGTPVSLMEAISCSIPLLVSDCGGNFIMAKKGGGWHFSVDDDAEKIAQHLHEVIAELTSDETLRMERKNSAHQVWKKEYNSVQNYEHFCDELQSLFA